MKVYVDFKCLALEDLPSNTSNEYYLIGVSNINGSSRYGRIELLDIADYTKQVRKEVCDKVREKFNEIIFDSSTIDEILDQIQGE